VSDARVHECSGRTFRVGNVQDTNGQQRDDIEHLVLGALALLERQHDNVREQEHVNVLGASRSHQQRRAFQYVGAAGLEQRLDTLSER